MLTPKPPAKEPAHDATVDAEGQAGLALFELSSFSFESIKQLMDGGRKLYPL
jgi:hypothetical protein